MNRHDAGEPSNDRNGNRRNGPSRLAAAAFASHSASGLLAFAGPGFPAATTEEADPRSVHWNQAESRFMMEDARIVTRANRVFCLRLIEVLLREGKARAAHLDFSGHRLAVEFIDRSTTRSEAARVLGDSIRLASIPVHSGELFESVPVRQNWDSFAFFADADRRPTIWWWIEPECGLARIGGNGLKSPDADFRSWSDLIPGVRSSRRRRLSKAVNLRFDKDRADLWNIVASIDELCRAVDARNVIQASRTAVSSSPASRVFHLGLAACSMTCAVVGILIPGVPTVPFVLLTSYHLAKSSDTIHAIFRQTPLFGSLGEDWEHGRFIRTKNKIWLISISTGVLVLSVSLTQPGGVALMTIATIYSLTTASVLVMPGSPTRHEMPRITPSRKLAMLPG